MSKSKISKLRNNYLPEFKAFFLGRSHPSMVTVNLTNKCNQRCIYCEIGSDIPSSRSEVLELNDLKWILDEMEKNNIPKISLCGGEPFLFKDIIEVVQYAFNKGIRCTITSNGMTIHKLSEMEISILQTCNTEVNISLDSFQQETQSLTRGVNTALSNALKSIEFLQHNNIPVTVLTAISKFNYTELFDFIKQAYSKNINQVLFQPIIYYSNYPDRQTIDQKAQFNVESEQIDILIEQLKKIYRFESKHGINTNIYRILPWIRSYISYATSQKQGWFFKDILNKFYCRDLFAIIDIAYDGGIQPCGLSISKINIRQQKGDDLIGLWKSATEELKEDISKEHFHEYCNGCCHHFSRNMLASVMKYPFQNRRALLIMTKLMFFRVLNRLKKKVIYKAT